MIDSFISFSQSDENEQHDTANYEAGEKSNCYTNPKKLFDGTS